MDDSTTQEERGGHEALEQVARKKLLLLNKRRGEIPYTYVKDGFSESNDTTATAERHDSPGAFSYIERSSGELSEPPRLNGTDSILEKSNNIPSDIHSILSHSQEVAFQNLDNLVSSVWVIQADTSGHQRFLDIGQDGKPIISSSGAFLRLSENWTPDTFRLELDSLDGRRCYFQIRECRSSPGGYLTWTFVFKNTTGDELGFYLEDDGEVSTGLLSEQNSRAMLAWKCTRQAPLDTGSPPVMNDNLTISPGVSGKEIPIQRWLRDSISGYQTNSLRLSSLRNLIVGGTWERPLVLTLDRFLAVLGASEPFTSMNLRSTLGAFLSNPTTACLSIYMNLPSASVRNQLDTCKPDLTRSTVQALFSPTGRLAIKLVEIVCLLTDGVDVEQPENIVGIDLSLGSEVKFTIDVPFTENEQVVCHISGTTILRTTEMDFSCSVGVLGKTIATIDFLLHGSIELAALLGSLSENGAHALLGISFFQHPTADWSSDEASLEGACNGFPDDDVSLEIAATKTTQTVSQRNSLLSKQSVEILNPKLVYRRAAGATASYSLESLCARSSFQGFSACLPKWLQQTFETEPIDIQIFCPFQPESIVVYLIAGSWVCTPHEELSFTVQPQLGHQQSETTDPEPESPGECESESESGTRGSLDDDIIAAFPLPESYPSLRPSKFVEHLQDNPAFSTNPEGRILAAPTSPPPIHRNISVRTTEGIFIEIQKPTEWKCGDKLALGRLPVILSATRSDLESAEEYQYTIKLPVAPTTITLREVTSALGVPNATDDHFSTLPIEDSVLESATVEYAQSTIIPFHQRWIVEDWYIQAKSHKVPSIDDYEMSIDNALVSLRYSNNEFSCAVKGMLTLAGMPKPVSVSAQLPQADSTGFLKIKSPEGIRFSDMLALLKLSQCEASPITGIALETELRRAYFSIGIDPVSPSQTRLLGTRLELDLEWMQLGPVSLHRPDITFGYQHHKDFHSLPDEERQYFFTISASLSNETALVQLSWDSISKTLKGTLHPTKPTDMIEILHSFQLAESVDTSTTLMKTLQFVRGEIVFQTLSSVALEKLGLEFHTETLHVIMRTDNLQKFNLTILPSKPENNLSSLLKSLLPLGMAQDSAAFAQKLGLQMKRADAALVTLDKISLQSFDADILEDSTLHLNQTPLRSPRLFYRDKKASPENPSKNRSAADVVLWACLESASTKFFITIVCLPNPESKKYPFELVSSSKEQFSIAAVASCLNSVGVKLWAPMAYQMSLDSVMSDTVTGYVTMVSGDNDLQNAALSLDSLKAVAHAKGSLEIWSAPNIRLENLEFNIGYSSRLGIEGALVGSLSVAGNNIILTYAQDKQGKEGFSGEAILTRDAQMTVYDLLGFFSIDSDSVALSENDAWIKSIGVDSLGVTVKVDQDLGIWFTGNSSHTIERPGLDVRMENLGGTLRLSKVAPEIRSISLVVEAGIKLNGFHSSPTSRARMRRGNNGTWMVHAAVRKESQFMCNLQDTFQAFNSQNERAWSDLVPTSTQTLTFGAKDLSMIIDLGNYNIMLRGDLARIGSVRTLVTSETTKGKQNWTSFFESVDLGKLWPTLSMHKTSLFRVTDATACIIGQPMTVEDLQHHAVLCQTIAEGSERPLPNFVKLLSPLDSSMSLTAGAWIFTTVAITKPKHSAMTRLDHSPGAEPPVSGTITMYAFVPQDISNTSYHIKVEQLELIQDVLYCDGQGTYHPESEEILLQGTITTKGLFSDALEFPAEVIIQAGKTRFRMPAGSSSDLPLSIPFPEMYNVKFGKMRISGESITLPNLVPVAHYSLEGDASFGETPTDQSVVGKIHLPDGKPRVAMVTFHPASTISITDVYNKILIPGNKNPCKWPSSLGNLEFSNAVIYYATPGPKCVVDGLSCIPGYHMNGNVDLFGEACNVTIDLPQDRSGISLKGSCQTPVNIGGLRLVGFEDRDTHESFPGAAVFVETRRGHVLQYKVRAGLIVFGHDGFDVMLDNRGKMFKGVANYNGTILGNSSPRISLELSRDGSGRLSGWEAYHYMDGKRLAEAIRRASKKDKKCACGELAGLPLEQTKTKVRFELSLPLSTREMSSAESLHFTVKVSVMISSGAKFNTTLDLGHLDMPIRQPVRMASISRALGDFVKNNLDHIGGVVLDDPTEFAALLSTIPREKFTKDTTCNLIGRHIKPPNLMKHAIHIAETMINGPTGITSTANSVATFSSIICGHTSQLSTFVGICASFMAASTALGLTESTVEQLTGTSGLGTCLLLALSDEDAEQIKYRKREEEAIREYRRAEEALLAARRHIEDLICLPTAPVLDFGPHRRDGCYIHLDWIGALPRDPKVVFDTYDEFTWEIRIGTSDTLADDEMIHVVTTDKSYVSEPDEDYLYISSAYAWIRARAKFQGHEFTASTWTRAHAEQLPRLKAPTSVELQIDLQNHGSISIDIDDYANDAMYRVELVCYAESSEDVVIYREDTLPGIQNVSVSIIDLPEPESNFCSVQASVRQIPAFSEGQESFVVLSDELLEIADSAIEFEAKLDDGKLVLILDLESGLSPIDFTYFLWRNGLREEMSVQLPPEEKDEYTAPATEISRCKVEFDISSAKQEKLLVGILQKSDPYEGVIYRCKKLTPSAATTATDEKSGTPLETIIEQEEASFIEEDLRPISSCESHPDDKSDAKKSIFEELLDQILEEPDEDATTSETNTVNQFKTASTATIVLQDATATEVSVERRDSVPKFEVLDQSVLVPDEQLLILRVRFRPTPSRGSGSRASGFRRRPSTADTSSERKSSHNFEKQTPLQMDEIDTKSVRVKSFLIRCDDGKILPESSCLRNQTLGDETRLYIRLEKPYPKSVQVAPVWLLNDERGYWCDPWSLPTVGFAPLSFTPRVVFYEKGAMRIQWASDWSLDGTWKEMRIAIFDEVEGCEIKSWTAGPAHSSVMLPGYELIDGTTGEYKLDNLRLLIRAYPAGDKIRGGISLVHFTLPESRTWVSQTVETKRAIALNSSISLIESRNATLGLLYTTDSGHVKCATKRRNWSIQGVRSKGKAISGGSCTAVLPLDESVEVFWIGPDGAIRNRYSVNNSRRWKEGKCVSLSKPAMAATDRGGAITGVHTLSNISHLFWIGRRGSVNGSWRVKQGEWSPRYHITTGGSVDVETMTDLVSLSPNEDDIYLAWIAADASVQIAHSIDSSSRIPSFSVTQITPPGSASRHTGLHLRSLPGSPQTIALFWISQDQSVMGAWNTVTAGNDNSSSNSRSRSTTPWAITTIDGPGSAHPESGLTSVLSDRLDASASNSRTIAALRCRSASSANLPNLPVLKPSTRMEPTTSFHLHLWYFTPGGALRCSTTKKGSTTATPGIDGKEKEAETVSVESTIGQQCPWTYWSTVQHHPCDGAAEVARYPGRRRIAARGLADGAMEVWYAGSDGGLVGYGSS